MSDYKFRWLDETEYSLIHPFFDNEGAPRLDPQFSRVVGAFTPSGDLAGFICLQMVAHAEPVFVSQEHRNSGLGMELTQLMDGYAEALGLAGLYTQPTNLPATKLASAVGFEPNDHPLWVKVYNSNFKTLMASQSEDL